MATPKANWVATAINKGILRPYLSAKNPNKMLPTRIPSIKNVWERLDKLDRVQTRSHSDWIVLVKIDWLNARCSQFASHLWSDSSTQENSGLGAIKMIANWCQAIGSFTRETAKHTKICHRPNSPISDWIWSLSRFSSPPLCGLSANEKKVFLFWFSYLLN